MIVKIAIFFAAFAAIDANVVLSAPILSTGVSSNSRQEDGLGNYAFNYGIADGKGATNSRTEVGDAHGNRKGAYTITDIDGRARRVEYVADALGFRASVKTNEPGTALSAPAAALIASPYAAPAMPAVAIAAPVLAHSAPLTPSVSSYQTVIGHGSALGVPGIIGAGIGKVIW